MFLSRSTTTRGRDRTYAVRSTGNGTMRGLAAIAALALLLLGSACRSVPEASEVPRMADQDRMAALNAVSGVWYVMARTPNLLERGHMDSQVTYALQADGRLSVSYQYRLGPQAPLRETSVQAVPLDDATPLQWRLRLLRMLPLNQRVLESAPDGSWMLLDSPERDLAWVLMREPVLDDAGYLQLRQKLQGHGVNIDKVWRVVQAPEQIGARGFDQPRQR